MRTRGIEWLFFKVWPKSNLYEIQISLTTPKLAYLPVEIAKTGQNGIEFLDRLFQKVICDFEVIEIFLDKPHWISTSKSLLESLQLPMVCCYRSLALDPFQIFYSHLYQVRFLSIQAASIQSVILVRLDIIKILLIMPFMIFLIMPSPRLDIGRPLLPEFLLKGLDGDGPRCFFHSFDLAPVQALVSNFEFTLSLRSTVLYSP